MRTMLFAMLIGLAVLAQPPSARAAEGAAKAAQAVIAAQIEAFRRDDGATAYSYASPEIQALFPSVEIFMSMVRKGYAPVYHPQRYEFSDGTVSGEAIVQAVEVTAADGSDWVAIYTLRPMPDGSLKITSCHLQKREGTGA